MHSSMWGRPICSSTRYIVKTQCAALHTHRNKRTWCYRLDTLHGPGAALQLQTPQRCGMPPSSKQGSRPPAQACWPLGTRSPGAPLFRKPPWLASNPWSCHRGNTLRVALSWAPRSSASRQLTARLQVQNGP